MSRNSVALALTGVITASLAGFMLTVPVTSVSTAGVEIKPAAVAAAKDPECENKETGCDQSMPQDPSPAPSAPKQTAAPKQTSAPKPNTAPKQNTAPKPNTAPAAAPAKSQPKSQPKPATKSEKKTVTKTETKVVPAQAPVQAAVAPAPAATTPPPAAASPSPSPTGTVEELLIETRSASTECPTTAPASTENKDNTGLWLLAMLMFGALSAALGRMTKKTPVDGEVKPGIIGGLLAKRAARQEAKDLAEEAKWRKRLGLEDTGTATA